MARIILNAPVGLQVDHINRDTLDNRRCNLRLATPSQNVAYAVITAHPSRSGFRGVSANKKPSSTWRATIKFNNRTITIGSFSDPVEAARAYDRKAYELFGSFARPNFPGGVG